MGDVGFHKAGEAVEVIREFPIPLGLDGAAYRSEVSAGEDLAQKLGSTGVPFLVFDGKYAVGGAQSSDVFMQAISRVKSGP